jgi:hypothetical protein
MYNVPYFYVLLRREVEIVIVTTVMTIFTYVDNNQEHAVHTRKGYVDTH